MWRMFLVFLVINIIVSLIATPAGRAIKKKVENKWLASGLKWLVWFVLFFILYMIAVELRLL